MDTGPKPSSAVCSSSVSQIPQIWSPLQEQFTRCTHVYCIVLCKLNSPSCAIFLRGFCDLFIGDNEGHTIISQLSGLALHFAVESLEWCVLVSAAVVSYLRFVVSLEALLDFYDKRSSEYKCGVIYKVDWIVLRVVFTTAVNMAEVYRDLFKCL